MICSQRPIIILLPPRMSKNSPHVKMTDVPVARTVYEVLQTGWRRWGSYEGHNLIATLVQSHCSARPRRANVIMRFSACNPLNLSPRIFFVLQHQPKLDYRTPTSSLILIRRSFIINHCMSLAGSLFILLVRTFHHSLCYAPNPCVSFSSKILLHYGANSSMY